MVGFPISDCTSWVCKPVVDGGTLLHDPLFKESSYKSVHTSAENFDDCYYEEKVR